MININYKINEVIVIKEMKYCMKHGSLSEENVIIEPRKNKEPYIRCKFCKLEKDRRWKANNWEQHKKSATRARNANRSKANEWNKMDRERDPEKYKKWSKEWKDRNREKVRKQEICRIHKLTIKQYDQMIKDQDNKCYICGKEETRGGKSGHPMPLTVDHTEKNGVYQVRKLLCHFCNIGIGNFKENISLLLKAIDYLKEHE
jgi:hypothetical protein